MASFICPECGKEYPPERFKDFEEHFNKHHPHSNVIVIHQTKYNARDVNLRSLIESVEKGTVRVRIEYDGGIIFKRVKSGREYMIEPKYITGTYEEWDE